MKKNALVLLIMSLLPQLVWAHDLNGGGGFMAGFGHPVLGLDHLLAMVCVGILSAQMGGRAIWSVPSVFVGVMLIGGVLGMEGVPLISVELGIAFSVFALGLALVAEKKAPPRLAILLVAIFAIFHGHAHGTEMPHLAEPALYALGFFIGTATLHIFGVLIGLFSKKINHGELLLRYLGAVITGVGVYLMAV